MRALMQLAGPDQLRRRRRRRSRCTGRGRWRPTCTTTTPTARTAASRSSTSTADAGGAARRHLRADDLPGERDAGGPEVRRLLARRSRQPAQGVRQEDPRADRRRARVSSRPAASAPATAQRSASTLFDIIEPFADYAFNKSHTYGYGLDRLPDRLPQGALPGRVLRLLLTQRQEQPRQARRSTSSDAGRWASRCSPRHQPVGHRLRGAPRRRRSLAASRLPSAAPGAITFGLSAVRNVGEGLVGAAARRARRQRSVLRASTTSPSGSRSRCSTSARSSR